MTGADPLASAIFLCVAVAVAGGGNARGGGMISQLVTFIMPNQQRSHRVLKEEQVKVDTDRWPRASQGPPAPGADLVQTRPAFGWSHQSLRVGGGGR